MPRPPIDDAEERLLAAGLKLFARSGVERVNTNAIARRARLGVGTFYKHFADKYALLRTIQLRTLAGVRAARMEALAEASGDPADQVLRAVEAVARFARAHPDAYRVTFGRERAGASRHGPVVSESVRPTAEGLRRLQLAGALDPELDVELAARAWLAMEVGTLLWWIDERDPVPLERLVANLARLHPAISRARARPPGSARPIVRRRRPVSPD